MHAIASCNVWVASEAVASEAAGGQIHILAIISTLIILHILDPTPAYSWYILVAICQTTIVTVHETITICINV